MIDQVVILCLHLPMSLAKFLEVVVAFFGDLLRGKKRLRVFRRS
jgi:hypothetical protein